MAAARGKGWSEGDDDQLLDRVKQRLSIDQIAERFGNRTPKAITARIAKMRATGRLPSSGRGPRPTWTARMSQTSARMWRKLGKQGLPISERYRQIAEAVNRSTSTVQLRFINFGPTFGAPHENAIEAPQRPPAGSTHVPPELLVDRDRRLLAPRSLTARLCGDPEPGRSALDRRNA